VARLINSAVALTVHIGGYSRWSRHRLDHAPLDVGLAAGRGSGGNWLVAWVEVAAVVIAWRGFSGLDRLRPAKIIRLATAADDNLCRRLIDEFRVIDQHPLDRERVLRPLGRCSPMTGSGRHG
jgi:hypothetical protein